MRVKFGVAVVILSLIAMLACGGGSSSSPSSSGSGGSGGSGGGGTPPPGPTLSSISVSGPGSIAYGSSPKQLTATGTYSDGSTQSLTSKVKWASSDSSVATISASGAVSPVKGGQTTITATSGTVDGALSLTVTVSLSSLVISPGSQGINVGDSLQLAATGTYQDGTTKDLTASATWSSSAIGIASVSTGGLATGLKGGQATITATSGAVKGSSALTVTALLSSITLTPPSPGVFVGSTLKFTATGNYNDGTTKNISTTVTWQSSDNSKATVSNTGLATGLHGGQATISASLGAVNQASALTVTALLKSLTVTPVGVGIDVGDTQQFNASGSFNDGTSQDLTPASTWSSSDVSKAVIGGGGLASGVAAGAVTITAGATSADGTVVMGSTALSVVNPPVNKPTLNGSYAFSLISADIRGPQFYTGSFIADGNGNITFGVEDANTVAGVQLGISLGGTYVIYSDGRGTITFGSNAIHSSGLVLRFVLSSGGDSGMLIQFDGKGTMKGGFELQNVAAFNNAAINGNYVFRLGGVDSAGSPMGQLGILAADGLGGISAGTIDSDDFGILSTNVSLTASGYSVSTDGRGTLQLTTASGTRNFAFYVVDSNKINLIQTDISSTSAVAGVAELQANQTYSASTANGGYVFLMDQPVVIGSGGSFDRGEFNKIGRITFDGVSAITAIQDEDNNYSNNPVTGITGSYSVGGLGVSGRGTMNEMTSLGSENYIFYMVSPTKMYMMQTLAGGAGAKNSPVGVALQQSGGPYSQATLSGSFAMYASELTEEYLENLILMQFDGLGSVSGISDSTVNGVPSSVVVTANYASGTNNPDPTTGRGVINVPNGLGANDYVFYLISPQSADVLGITPDTDGVMAQQ